MVILAIILAVLGAAAAWLGWRGFRVGQHPHCRACDFDLYNLPEETQRCPECGAYIKVEDAVRLGRRRPVRVMVALGLVLMVLGAGLGLPGVRGLWGGMNVARLKTVGWLRSDLEARDEAVRRRAAEELGRRLDRGAMRDAQLEDVVMWILARQADPAVTWEPAWGDVVQKAHARGRLGTGRWMKYLEGTVHLRMRVRPRVRVGDPIPVEVLCRLRAGRESGDLTPGWVGMQIEAEMEGEKADLGTSWAGIDVVPLPMTFTKLWLPGSGEGWPAGMARPGERKVRLQVKGTIKDRDGIIATVVRQGELTVEVLVKEQLSVMLGEVTEAQEQEMETAVRLRGTGEVPPVPGGAVGTLWVAGPPMAAAFRVVLRQEGREWLLARTLVRMDGAVNEALRLPMKGEMPSPGPAEVVCVPEPEGAVGTVEVLEVWPKEVRRAVVVGRGEGQ